MQSSQFQIRPFFDSLDDASIEELPFVSGSIPGMANNLSELRTTRKLFLTDFSDSTIVHVVHNLLCKNM